MRTVPSEHHRDELRAFDEQTRAVFTTVTGITLSEAQWGQASRGLWCGGLGLRSASQHAAAAFVASRTATRQKCQEVDANFTWDLPDPQSALGVALTALNAELHPVDKVAADSTAVLRQQHLSQALDRVAHEAHYDALSPADRADLLSEMLLGASTFLEAVPCKVTGQAWEPVEFTTELRRRLLAPVYAEETWCPACDAVLDVKGRHAVACCAGGDRTTRHHAARNEVGHFASEAGQHPELEKAGLLPPGPDNPGSNLRRPADVYLPSWKNGAPAAFDLAVMSPQRQDILSRASLHCAAAAEACESYKREYLGTAADCQSQGLSFIPMVAEPSGGWGPSGACTLKALSKAAAVRSTSGAEPSAVLAEHLQRLCAAIRRASARAILRRDGGAESSSCPRQAALAVLAEPV